MVHPANRGAASHRIASYPCLPPQQINDPSFRPRTNQRGRISAVSRDRLIKRTLPQFKRVTDPIRWLMTCEDVLRSHSFLSIGFFFSSGYKKGGESMLSSPRLNSNISRRNKCVSFLLFFFLFYYFYLHYLLFICRFRV